MRKVNIHLLGEKIETQYHEMIARGVYSMVKGFFHFKKSKGEVYAASATLFSLLSLPPLILLLISFLGYLSGDVLVAKQQVLLSLKDTFPQVAPWIMKSIENIITAQLNSSARMNWINIVVLAYSGMGVISTVMYGLATIARSKTRGGVIFDDLRAF